MNRAKFTKGKNMTAKIIVGDKVQIRLGQSWMSGEWGIVREVNGDEYHVAPYNDEKMALIYSRAEIRLARNCTHQPIN
jgi:transcription elongation factor